MTMSEKDQVIVVGAGLAGSLLATGLASRGFRVRLFEKRADMRKIEMAAGRSINLALSHRGLIALEKIGLAEEMLEIAIPMKGRFIHTPDGPSGLMPYSSNPADVIHSISRHGLNSKLMDAAERAGVTINFEAECKEVNFFEGSIRVVHRDGEEETVYGQAIFGADGAPSAVRGSMQQKHPRFNYSQHFLEYGYKELSIPADDAGKHQLEMNSLHIWPRGEFMLIALPNLDGSFTCTLFLPFEGRESFEVLNSDTEVINFFSGHFTDAYNLMPSLLEDFFANPTGILGTISCYPWQYNDRALLVGDAAHAIVPFYGQGMNCAFEDCSILMDLVDASDKNWSEIFNQYQRERKADTDAIAQLALDNFIEMRDSVANPKFGLKRKLEHKLEREFPGRFTSRYSMVTFGSRPYRDALLQGSIQDVVLMKLVQKVSSIDEVDPGKALQEIEAAIAAVKE